MGAEIIKYYLIFTKSLTTLNLQDNMLGIKGALLLAEGQVNNNSLRSLNISYNEIKAEGSQFLIECFKSTKIQSLYFGGNNIKEDGGKNLAELIKSIFYLFNNNNDIGPAVISYITLA